jgi:hypothetical protein
VVLTTDKNMQFQQNIANRRIAVIILGASNGRSFDLMSS